MNSIEFTIIAHTRKDESVPFQEAMMAFGAYSPDLQAAVRAGLVRLRVGSNHGLPLTKHLEDNLCYVRIKRARIFFIFLKDARIVLLNGLIKNQKKLPSNAIELARTLRKEAMA